MGQRQREPLACSDSIECSRKPAAPVLGLGRCSEGSHGKGWSFLSLLPGSSRALEWCALVGRAGSTRRLEQAQPRRAQRC